MQRRNQTEYGVRKASRRKSQSREPRPRLLIVCEGETEAAYVRGFGISSATIEVARGNGPFIIEKAAELRNAMRKRAERDGYSDKYDHVWCVFDKNSTPDDQFDQAISTAKKKNIKVAYSNEAFELWFLLHFDYQDAALSRTQYATKLKERLGQYEKPAREMYRALLATMDTAITNAERLMSTYTPHRPAEDNPSTTVHELVRELRKQPRGF